MEMDTVCFVCVFEELLGSNKFNAFGLTKVDVNIKNMSNKKTMSVIEDMLKFGLTLFLDRSPIISQVR